MVLNDAAMAWLDTALCSAEADARSLAEFRRDFPGCSLTRCDVSDMGVEAPFREYPQFNLYLVDASGHCWRLTDDPARATGVVVARK